MKHHLQLLFFFELAIQGELSAENQSIASSLEM
jgi:hypothetical protein